MCELMMLGHTCMRCFARLGLCMYCKVGIYDGLEYKQGLQKIIEHIINKDFL